MWREFEKTLKKNLVEYHDLHLKSDELLLAEGFENFIKMCLKLYHLDPVNVHPAVWLVLRAAWKKTEVKLELLTDIDMLLMVEKGIRGVICDAVNQHAKANSKRMKDYDKKVKNHYILNIGMSIIYMVGQCHKSSQ